MPEQFDITAAVKRKLQITWSDEDTDARVADLIDDARASLIFKLGLAADHDFTEAGLVRSLLLNLCFYEWNNAADDFDANYHNEILQARQARRVEEAADAETDEA